MSRRIVVIGGGITGLATAWRVRQLVRDAEVTLLESSARPGGMVGTIQRDGFLVERGPNGLFDAKPAGVTLARDLGLGDRLIAGSEASRKNRFLFAGDRLHRLPSSPLGILTNPVLSLSGRLRLITEPFRRPRVDPTDESIAEFANRHFGREAAERLVDAIVTGIYAGDPETLSVRSCFPRLVKAEAMSGSVLRGILRMRKEKAREARSRGEPPPGPQRLWSFPTGLHELTDLLAERLRNSFVGGVTVKSIGREANGWIVRGEGNETWRADIVVSCLPPYEQSILLDDLSHELADEFAQIPINRVTVVALGYRRDQVTGPQDGFGYLSPQRDRRDVLGVQWCSSVFPGRAPEGCVLWRALVGGVARGDLTERSDEDLLKFVHREMSVTMGVTGEPVFSEIVRWPRAIPQYLVGHGQRVGRIEALAAAFPGLILGGTALSGVALADRVEEAMRIAAHIAR
jgi:oxygen-dependent protoporphyrinogen oxidase